MDTTAVTLPEELLLLAIDPSSGRPRGTMSHTRYGVAGAVLAELEAAGRIGHDRGRISVADGRPTGDPLLDSALGRLPAAGKAVSARRWIRRESREMTEVSARSLAKRGAIRIEKRRALGLFPYHRYPSAGRDWSAPALARFQGDAKVGFPDARGRMLAALVSASDLARRVHPGSGDARRARKEMRGLAREYWQSDAVRRVVSADKASAANSAS
jgi:hypothetical protein